METASAAPYGLGLKLPARRFLPPGRDPSPETVLPTRILYVHPASRPTRGCGRDLLAVSASGITVNPHEPVALAEAMAALSDDRLRRDRMARNARPVPREVFPTERIADRRLGAMAESRQPQARPARR